MNNFKNIQNKLEAFIKKYYTNALIKGAILFFATGVLYFLFTVFIEYMLWLSTGARTALFWIFILVEIGLFAKFIAVPLSKLFKLQRGIDYKDASKIIGNHFPEVNDKLLNVLQLNEDAQQSELLLASIEQKSIELSPIPFKLAINLKGNIKYLKYAAIPVMIVLLSLLTGHFNWFSDGYERVVNYQTAYEPPAPFQFFVINEDLKAIENKAFKLQVQTQGEVIPESVQITYNNETYYLKELNPGLFEYTFSQPKSNIEFNLFANNVNSKPYTLEVIGVPTLLSFDMILDYPAYTKKKDEVLKSAGNAIVPQGTKITWDLKTKSTNTVTLTTRDSVFNFEGDSDNFKLSQRLNRNLDYSLNTSNENLKNYENLSFSIDVIRDEHPELNMQMEQDSLDSQTLYFYGQVSDDYGLNKLQLVFYPLNDESKKQTVKLNVAASNFDEFISVFPDQLELEDGVSYDLYFEVFDNDVIHGYKSTKSNVFSYRKLTKNEVKEEQLKEQSETIENLNNSLEKLEEQDNELQEFSKTQKEKAELNFNDKKKFENFLKRQKKQEDLLQNFNKKLKNNLEEFQKENKEEDPFKEALKKRLEENNEQLKKDEKLLEELEKLAEKLEKEELTEKLEELAKQNKNKKRSLEQLVELTKRYYVTKKAEKLKDDLAKLAEKQEEQSEKSSEENTKEEQDKLNKEFEDIQKELEDLQKENKKLKQPLQVPEDKKEEEEIKKEQKEASENLDKKEQSQNEEKEIGAEQNNEEQQQKQEEQKQSENKAKKNQKKAAQKLRKMSESLSQPAGGGGGEQISEDIDMLRQILDNLVLFSFDQEDLMEQFKSIQVNHNEYAGYLRKQQGLKEHFEHVDDSLFALSLRQPSISEQINKEITEVFFNVDKSLSQLAENRLYQGVAAQQYTVTAANTLADFLSDMLDNLSNQLNPSPGKGKGGESIPDIIISQEELKKQFEEGKKKSDNGKKENGEKPGDKKGKQQGQGKDGEKGEQEGEGQQGDQEGSQLGNGEGNSEELNGELFRIFQQQQQLRQALQDKLAKEGKGGIGEELSKAFDEVEENLLNSGFTNQTLQKIQELQHQLLKLENATFEQGQDNKRKSKTNDERFNNTTNNRIPQAKEYFNTTEILNRQTLPLQQVYKKKVLEYFKTKNDQL
ncbi:DUF4175 family protein [Flavobacteriaceae bacterium AU392]|nr:DUF4175 family protein [Flavobacteriaceae bacterium]RKM84837.1 DUF4175 family protein [Flavobacteriaceae bacterium AU392]